MSKSVKKQTFMTDVRQARQKMNIFFNKWDDHLKYFIFLPNKIISFINLKICSLSE